MPVPSPTRGSGLLERFLAEQRIHRANKLIPPSLRTGKVLDIGCGSHPLFLLNTDFAQKFGMDKHLTSGVCEDREGRCLNISTTDFEQEGPLPFAGDSFDVITLLAVLEHCSAHRVDSLLREILRILRPGGMLIMTLPSAWTDGLLRMLAFLHLVSSQEIEDHKATYTIPKTLALLQAAGFKQEHLSAGRFEACMNLWFAAKKN
jgi:SAM-dependent methyltransferase